MVLEITSTDNAPHLALEYLRRVHLAISAIGADEVSLLILAVLVPSAGKFHSTTVLLNKTGLRLPQHR